MGAGMALLLLLLLVVVMVVVLALPFPVRKILVSIAKTPEDESAFGAGTSSH